MTAYFRAYAVGLCSASVCTNLPDNEATDRLNEAHPTFIPSSWGLSSDATFADGTPIPAPCPDRDDCRHILFEC